MLDGDEVLRAISNDQANYFECCCQIGQHGLQWECDGKRGKRRTTTGTCGTEFTKFGQDETNGDETRRDEATTRCEMR